MISKPLRHRTSCIAALLALSAFGVAWAAEPVDRPDRPDQAERGVSITHPTVTLAASCDLHGAIATLRLHVHNRANEGSPAKSITVLDSARALAGRADVPILAAKQATWIDVPMPLADATSPVPGAGPAAIAGQHTFDVYVLDRPPGNERLTNAVAHATAAIPATFCAQAIALSASATAPTPASAYQSSKASSQTKAGLKGTTALSLFRAAAAAATPAASPTPNAALLSAAQLRPKSLLLPTVPVGVRQKVTERAGATTLIFPSPRLLHAVTGEHDCYDHFAAHYGFEGTVECRALIAGGRLVLIWDRPLSGSPDGYRVHASNASGALGAMLKSVNDPAQTLAQLPPQPSGVAGSCYVVTATYGNAESAPAFRFCPDASATTVSQTFSASYTHFSYQSRKHDAPLVSFASSEPIGDGAVVGYFYSSDKHLLGDQSYNKIRRYAVAFNVDALRGKRLLLARLHLTIQQSYGQGNNHSCATTVGGGTEFWWKSDAAAWTDGNFVSGARVSDTGPEVTADVTSLVLPILAGSPNYGFVIRNDDENLDSFTNATCETMFGNPQLELVYYNS